QYRHLSLIQCASVLGPYGLGALIVAWNASLASAWPGSAGGRPALSARVNVSLCAALVLAAWAWGQRELLRRAATVPERTAVVEILQPDVDQYQKWDESYEDRIRANFEELLARPRAAAPALIVWPESCLPRWAEEKGELPEASPWSRKL